jgi:gamma-glutamylcyclotransferase (GGCT)/AIG2-like uncharacterized protein YtfP
MNKNHLYAFYGSLRKNMYNAKAVGDANMKYLKTVQIPGFELYNLSGAYPCAIRTDNPDDILTVDLFEVSTAREYGIHAMEIGAGYDYDEVEIGGTNYGIYTYDKSYRTRLANKLIPGGDWVKYLQEISERATTI